MELILYRTLDNANVINKVLSLYTKKTEVITKKGKDTYAFERFKAFPKPSL